MHNVVMYFYYYVVYAEQSINRRVSYLQSRWAIDVFFLNTSYLNQGWRL